MVSFVVILFLGLIIYISQKNLPAPTINNLTQVYEDEIFLMRYPNGFIVDDKYVYQELGPEKNINGVKFTIPLAMTTGTNLSSDSYLSVENISPTKNCVANLFLEQNVTSSIIKDGGVTYSVAQAIGAAAGNRYEETVYAISGSNPCLAVRYFIHYGAIENYPTGIVQEFDKQKLINEFDAIRRTLTRARQN